MLRMFLFFLLGSLSLCCSNGNAAPFRFDSAPRDVQDFVVLQLANCITNSHLVLVYSPCEQELANCPAIMPYHVRYELGLAETYCVEVLKGDISNGGFKRCYLYETPRRAFALPPLFEIDTVMADGPQFAYYDQGTPKKPYAGKKVYVSGRMLWRYFPPYDPYRSYRDEFVKLMLLTPEPTLDVTRIKLNKWHCGSSTIADVIGKDYTRRSPAEIMRKLAVETAFSNRVFRMNEACAFQVDFRIPDNIAFKWHGLEAKELHMERLKGIQAGNSVLMHLSSEEVSEIVYLAYLADGNDLSGYETAISRCPEVLKPVSEVRTAVGKRVNGILTYTPKSL